MQETTGNIFKGIYPKIKRRIKKKLLNMNNALTEINFNSTNFIKAQLTQRLFSVWPMDQPVDKWRCTVLPT